MKLAISHEHERRGAGSRREPQRDRSALVESERGNARERGPESAATQAVSGGAPGDRGCRRASGGPAAAGPTSRTDRASLRTSETSRSRRHPDEARTGEWQARCHPPAPLTGSGNRSTAQAYSSRSHDRKDPALVQDMPLTSQQASGTGFPPEAALDRTPGSWADGATGYRRDRSQSASAVTAGKPSVRPTVRTSPMARSTATTA